MLISILFTLSCSGSDYYLKSKGYSKHIEQWAQRQKLLNDLGWSVQDRDIWRASVNPAALALLLQAAAER